MRNIYITLLALLPLTALAQPPINYAVRIEAKAESSAGQIILRWKTVADTGSIIISRKNKKDTTWSQVITLPDTATTFTDNSVSIGDAFEYRINKRSPTNPVGYIYAGMEVPATHNRGTILVLIDSTFSLACSSEIKTLMQDLRGDGWQVMTKHFSRNDSVSSIKNYIIATAQNKPELEALFILGHIAVPYSGDLNPDGHADHRGAWPADAYYGDIDGTWTDSYALDTNSQNPLNHNVPGDGKFDASYIPSDIDLQVGRVDVYDMPMFAQTEVQLMKNYLHHLHRYKTGQLNIVKRAYVDDHFQWYTEKFSSMAWDNFSSLVGIDSVSEKDMLFVIKEQFHQWAFGCGGGTFTRCYGAAWTDSFVVNNPNSIFISLFGSYFGDWNYTDGLLKAPLCADTPALASFWGGRPYWYVHHMALGETFGYATRLTQNNDSVYHTPIKYLLRTVNLSALGDPTLRTDYMQPLTSLTVNSSQQTGAMLSWTSHTAPDVNGYYIYRSSSEFGKYELRSGLVTGTSFTDSFGTDGEYWYMVRASKLQTTASGTYYNLSPGTTVKDNIQYYNSIDELNNTISAALVPNPAIDKVLLQIHSEATAVADIIITSLNGKVMFKDNIDLRSGDNTRFISIANLSSGIYLVNIRSDIGQSTLKLSKTY